MPIGFTMRSLVVAAVLLLIVALGAPAHGQAAVQGAGAQGAAARPFRLVYVLFGATGGTDSGPAGRVIDLPPGLYPGQAQAAEFLEWLRSRFKVPSLAVVASAQMTLEAGTSQFAPGRAGRFDVRITLDTVGEREAALRLSLVRGDKVLSETMVALPNDRRVVLSTGDGGDTGFIVLGAATASGEPGSTAGRGGVAPYGPGITPPVKILDVKPRYPMDAMKKRIQGLVALSAMIGLDGVPRDVVVVRSVPGLDEAAIEALRDWRFQPAKNAAGQPIEIRMIMTVKFALQQP